MQPVTLALPESRQFPLDPNGVPIKPGYRKPFTSETARKAQATSASVRRANGLTAKLQRDSRIIYEVLNQVRIMLENRRKRGSRGVLQKSNHGQSVGPISPTISPRPIRKNASQVKPEGIKPAVSTVTPKTEPLPGQA